MVSCGSGDDTLAGFFQQTLLRYLGDARQAPYGSYLDTGCLSPHRKMTKPAAGTVKSTTRLPSGFSVTVIDPPTSAGSVE